MTIGFNHLGRHGRLGNQMFQYAGLRGIAAHRGFDFMIPESNFKDEWNDHQLFEAFKLKGLTNIGVCPGPYVKEAHFHFDQNLYDNMPDGHNVYAYLQSTKYFDIIEKEIREDFEFKNEIKAPCEDMISTVQDPIALHVRRVITYRIVTPIHPAPKNIMIVHCQSLIRLVQLLFFLTILNGVVLSSLMTGSLSQKVEIMLRTCA